MAVADDVERALELLSIRPQIGSIASNSSPTGLRRILLGRIGYHLYYTHSDEERTVLILAFWHVRRGSGPHLESERQPE